MLEKGGGETLDASFHAWRRKVLEAIDSGAEFKINEIAIELIKGVSILPLVASNVFLEYSLPLVFDGPFDIKVETEIDCDFLDILQIDVAILRLYGLVYERLGKSEFQRLVHFRYS